MNVRQLTLTCLSTLVGLVIQQLYPPEAGLKAITLFHLKRPIYKGGLIKDWSLGTYQCNETVLTFCRDYTYYNTATGREIKPRVILLE